ncbi:ATPase [Mucilaginibacter limnophilus]|uniref:ATPase n=1 Tax=Mucilaginibacter limnophilus TaxID=1932778 RepID=A0A3S2Y2U1_9SPHI|nr:SRPBCC domain-containing protein [Mucilaginibacter limnophilus]RVU00616.1 ATPase [Mucilaginibacter limnophilus]
MEKVTGETKAVGFEVGARKTFDISLQKAWDFLFSDEGLALWLGNIAVENLSKEAEIKSGDVSGTIKVVKPYSHIRMRWKRADWDNTSTLQVRVLDAKGKATISFHQEQLQDSKQRDEMKAHWQKVLEKISAKLS